MTSINLLNSTPPTFEEVNAWFKEQNDKVMQGLRNLQECESADQGCPVCQGTGEGLHDQEICWSCDGTGICWSREGTGSI